MRNNRKLAMESLERREVFSVGLGLEGLPELVAVPETMPDVLPAEVSQVGAISSAGEADISDDSAPDVHSGGGNICGFGGSDVHADTAPAPNAASVDAVFSEYGQTTDAGDAGSPAGLWGYTQDSDLDSVVANDGRNITILDQDLDAIVSADRRYVPGMDQDLDAAMADDSRNITILDQDLDAVVADNGNNITILDQDLDAVLSTDRMNITILDQDLDTVVADNGNNITILDQDLDAVVADQPESFGLPDLRHRAELDGPANETLDSSQIVISFPGAGVYIGAGSTTELRSEELSSGSFYQGWPYVDPDLPQAAAFDAVIVAGQTGNNLDVWEHAY